MQLVASAGLVVTGLLLALLMQTSADMRVYGWILVGIGLLGLASRSWMARLRDDRPGRRGP
jgi:hypothetical protein